MAPAGGLVPENLLTSAAVRGLLLDQIRLRSRPSSSSNDPSVPYND
jgi:hypothetical protein